MQIKAGGSYAQAHHPNPDLTFSLRSTHGLHIEVMNIEQTATEYHDMLSMDAAKGQWIQVVFYDFSFFQSMMIIYYFSNSSVEFVTRFLRSKNLKFYLMTHPKTFAISKCRTRFLNKTLQNNNLLKLLTGICQG